MKLRIELTGDVFAPGDRLAGRVHVAEGGGSRSLEVLLRFIEERPDYRTGVRIVSGAVLYSGELETGQVVVDRSSCPRTRSPTLRQTMRSSTGSSTAPPTSSASTATPAKRSRSSQTALGGT